MTVESFRSMADLEIERDDLEAQLQTLRDSVYDINEAGRLLQLRISAVKCLIMVATNDDIDPGPPPQVA